MSHNAPVHTNRHGRIFTAESEHNASFVTRNFETGAVVSESTGAPETMSPEMDSHINSDNEKGEKTESDHETSKESESESDVLWFDALETMSPEMDSRIDSDNEKTESDHETSKKSESETESDVLWFDALETMSPEMDSSIDSDNAKTESDHENRKQSESESEFLCNICLDTARSPVVSRCGHLYCWPCIQQWLETRPIRQLCPVCREPLDGNSNMIPLYSRNGVNQEDPRVNLPSRQSTEVIRQQQVIRPDFHTAFGIIIFGLDFGISQEFGENPEMARSMGMILTFLYNVILWFFEPYF